MADRTKILTYCGIGIILCIMVMGFMVIAGKDTDIRPDETKVSLAAPEQPEEHYTVDNRKQEQGRTPSQGYPNADQQANRHFTNGEATESPSWQDEQEIRRIQEEILAMDRANTQREEQEERIKHETYEESRRAKIGQAISQLEERVSKTDEKTVRTVDSVMTDADSVAQGKSESSRFSRVSTAQKAKANSIRALVHSKQTVQVGSTLKMRITEDCVTDNGVKVKKNSFVFGQVTAIRNERVIVRITTVNVNGSILPFHKDVYSRDAQKGIYVPNTGKAETIKDMESSAVSQSATSVTVPSGSLATQLGISAINGAAGGIKQAAGKNIRRTKVTIKTNYELLFMECLPGDSDYTAD